MAKCPYCGYEGGFKLLKTWRYRWRDIYFYECMKRCTRLIPYVDPKDKRRSFAILYKPKTVKSYSISPGEAKIITNIVAQESPLNPLRGN